jgi:hypothetical protein
MLNFKWSSCRTGQAQRNPFPNDIWQGQADGFLACVKKTLLLMVSAIAQHGLPSFERHAWLRGHRTAFSTVAGSTFFFKPTPVVDEACISFDRHEYK